MTCYHPIRGYRSRAVSANGKRPIVFNTNLGYADLPVDVPCGQCVGCRLRRSRTWALRCVHEASLWPKNCFVTLTYNDEHLPADLSLNVKHFQDFMKRLRFKFNASKENPIRFFHCGEYGEVNERPHYHAILFNHEFSDKYPWRKGKDADTTLWRSPTLDALWPFGFSSIGTVTFKSAAYCARYIMKKMTGPAGVVYQEHLDPNTGQLYSDRLPPYVTMSRRDGVGKGWLDRFKDDVYPDDFIVLLDGSKHAVPAYYDAQLDEAELRSVKIERVLSAKRRADDNTPDRLKVKEVVLESRISKLKRDL